MDVVALALEQARGKVEKLQHKISKAILVSGEGTIGGGNFHVLRGLEAELAVEQRLVGSLEAALTVSADNDLDLHRQRRRLPHPSSPSDTSASMLAGASPGRVDARGLDQIKQLDATIQILVERLQRACEQPERNVQQLSNLFKDKRVLQRRVAALEKSEREALAACDRHRRQGDKATASVLRLRAENNRLKSDADKMALQLSAAEEELEKLRKHTHELHEQLQRGKAELGKAELAREREVQRGREREQERRHEAELLARERESEREREQEREQERERERERESERQRERASDTVKLKLLELENLKKTLHDNRPSTLHDNRPSPVLPPSPSQTGQRDGGHSGGVWGLGFGGEGGSGGVGGGGEETRGGVNVVGATSKSSIYIYLLYPLYIEREKERERTFWSPTLFLYI
jgi:chromosome segregation ATPase